jgi:hypothetical protein
MRKLTLFLGTIGFVLVTVRVFGQTPVSTPTPTMTVDEYEPRSTLVVPQHLVTRAKYPFIDVHTHYEQHHLFAKHPRTKFIAAHLSWLVAICAGWVRSWINIQICL